MCSMREATILHADLDSFFASVEQRDQPELLGRPVAVGGGVVLAASYEAKARGVRTPMGERMARSLCPDLVVVSPHMEAYSDASKAVFAIFEDTTPLVEGISIDEAFLEVGGLRRISGTPVEIAIELRRRVRAEVGLPITVGVARTKHLAKVASAAAKPNGLLVVPPDGEEDFLFPLPVERIWGVGAITASKLHNAGIYTVGELAAVHRSWLNQLLGPAAGDHLHALSRNQDPRRVVVGRRRRSVGSQRALGRRRRSTEEVATILSGIVDRVMRRLRTGGRAGRTVTVRFRFDDFSRATRSSSLPEATDRTEPVLEAAQRILLEASPMIRSQGLTLIGMAISNLDGDEAIQLPLPFDKYLASTLDFTLDQIRHKFGNKAVTRASLLTTDRDWEMPVLPD